MLKDFVRRHLFVHRHLLLCRELIKGQALSWARLSLLALVAWQWGGAAWIFGKAQMAQWLLADAWATTMENPQSEVKPWPWADTWPVARLQIPIQNVDLFVLAGAQGNSLAFGPGHMHGTALPGEGFSVIGGHRDTHFGFLQHLIVGDEISIENATGEHVVYQVQHIEIVDSTGNHLVIDPQRKGLVLVTCYPFDGIETGGPLRYLVWADEIPVATYSL